MLGSIARMRSISGLISKSDMKKVSHLVVGDERWGWVNNAGWKENALTFSSNEGLRRE